MSKQKREARRAARIARVKQRQANKTARQAQRQEARAGRAAVRQASRLAKVAKRKKISEQLENLGAASEAVKAAGAVRNATVAGKIKRYVEKNVEPEMIPEDAAPEEMAALAAEAQNEEIQDVQEGMNETLEEGEQPYTAEEAEEYCYDMYEADSFDGDELDNYDPVTAAAAKAAAKKGLELLATRRAKQGKKTLGMTPEELKKTLTPNYAPEKDPTSDAGKIIAAGKEEYIKQTAKTSSDTIVVIVLILLVIGAAIALSTRASK